MKARIKFRKYGIMRFVGHLDVMRYFQKVMRRADIPIAFTGGFSPHMIMSFAQPLGVGVTSDGEYLDIELTEPISSAQAIRQMNETNVEGIEVVDFVQIPDDKKSSGMTIVAAADYRVTLLKSAKSAEEARAIPEQWKVKAEGFLNQSEICVMKKTKRSEKEVDIKQMIYRMNVSDESVYLFLATGSEQNLKPELVMKAFLAYMDEEVQEYPMHYHRIDVYARNQQISDGTEDALVKGKGLVSLATLGKEIL